MPIITYNALDSTSLNASVLFVSLEVCTACLNLSTSTILCIACNAQVDTTCLTHHNLRLYFCLVAPQGQCTLWPLGITLLQHMTALTDAEFILVCPSSWA